MVLFDPFSIRVLPRLFQGSNCRSAMGPVNEAVTLKFGGKPQPSDTLELQFGNRFSLRRKRNALAVSSRGSYADVRDMQAWKFAALVQRRLMYPVNEKIIAVPASPTPGSQDWNGGVYTYIAPDGTQVRVGRTRNGIDRGGETWVDCSQDGGKTWHRKAAITKDDETAGGKQVASVERPYMYGKIVHGKPWVVLGTCAAEKGTKCWDIHERQAPLAHLERLQDAPVRIALPGNNLYAYKDGVPIQAPDGKGAYLAATRHHIGGTPESAVNADTVLCRLNEDTGIYEIIADNLFPRGSRGDMDKTCNRLSSELVLPDGSRFWGCDIRNAEEPNAALKTPLKRGKIKKWVLGDFDEITSFAIGTWPAEASVPKVTSVDAILGRSLYRRYPTLRYLGIAPLVSSSSLDISRANDPVLLLTYEIAGPTGAKSTCLQTISRKEMSEVLVGKGPKLLIGQDPYRMREWLQAGLRQVWRKSGLA